MAAGFNPKYRSVIFLNGLSHEVFLTLADKVIHQLGWEMTHISNLGIIAHIPQEMFASNAEIRMELGKDIVRMTSTSTDGNLFDFGANKKNTIRFNEKYNEIRHTLSEEALVSEHEQTLLKTAYNYEESLIRPKPSFVENLIGIFSIVKPTEGYTITPIVVSLNVLLFFLMVFRGGDFFHPSGQTILAWGGNLRTVTITGQWWRLVSNCFLHYGIFHLVTNMAALVYIGSILEPHLGRSRYLLAYFLSGLAASTASIWWHENAISAGASGAIFGLYGLYLALLTTNLIGKETRKPLLISIAIFIAINLMPETGVDSAAHIGGIVSGMLIGYAFVPGLKHPNFRLKIATNGLLSLLILFTCWLVCNGIKLDSSLYASKMRDFQESEHLAMEVYDKLKYDTKEDILYELKSRSNYYWEENLKLTEEIAVMDIPQSARLRNDRLREYCELRIKCNDLLYKSIQTGSNSYNEEISEYNEKIITVTDLLTDSAIKNP